MASGDFAAVPALYAPTETMTQTDAQGIAHPYRGRTQLLRFYQQLRAAHAVYSWTVDRMQVLSRTVVLSDAHATASSLLKPEPSSHLFVIQKGAIVRLGATTFSAGQRVF